jgi:hypothetical protein
MAIISLKSHKNTQINNIAALNIWPISHLWLAAMPASLYIKRASPRVLLIIREWVFTHFAIFYT